MLFVSPRAHWVEGTIIHQVEQGRVTYEVPLGTPPAAGWPTVLYFQGSFFAGSRAFADLAAVAGQYNLTRSIRGAFTRWESPAAAS